MHLTRKWKKMLDGRPSKKAGIQAIGYGSAAAYQSSNCKTGGVVDHN